MISQHTRLAVLLGSPVAHSRSPAMLNAAFSARKIDAVYLAWDVPANTFAATVATLATTRALGANVTVPHKERAAKGADSCSSQVQLLGAANCLQFVDGHVVAHNTDAPGLALAMRSELGRMRGPALVLGAGGAARAALLALRDRGINDVRLVNRDVKRRRALQRLARTLGLTASAHGWDELPALLPDVALLINATSAQVRAEPLVLPLRALSKHAVVYDLTYGNTPLIRAARTAGLRAFEGSGMLLHQAALAFTLWTGKKAPLAVMRAALSAR